MANSSNGRASFWTQANALLRKNLTFQKRNKRSNVILIAFPLVLCILLVLLQALINRQLSKAKYQCGCAEVNSKTECGVQYSTADQVASCAIPSPPEWPPLLQVPAPEYRATRTDYIEFLDLPDESCMKTGTCPVATLLTGSNQSFGLSLAGNLFPTSSLSLSDVLGSLTNNSSGILDILANNVLGSSSMPGQQNFLDSAYTSDMPVYFLRPQCTSTSPFFVPLQIESLTLQQELQCVRGLQLWRNSSSEINDELYKGYHKGNPAKKINEIVSAYDLLNSNMNGFNVTIWYNSTYKNNTGASAMGLVRVPRSVNLVSNAYLELLLGFGTKMLFKFVKEMPKPKTQLRLDISSLLSAQFFTYVIMALFPTVLTSLIYEKQRNLRIMMKMHGLGDGPYWTISYAYFLAISLIYMLCFAIFGSVIGLKIFTMNDYSIQFVFYFIYINLQISLAFFVAPLFSSLLTARAVGFLLTFGTGLLGGFLFQFFIEDTSFPRGWIIVMELYPGFSLFRGLYELGQYAFIGNLVGTDGMRWESLGDSNNGMREVLIIMVIEWLLLLPTAFYVDQVTSSGSGVKKGPLFFLSCFHKKTKSSLQKHSLRRQGLKVCVDMEKADVI